MRSFIFVLILSALSSATAASSQESSPIEQGVEEWWHLVEVNDAPAGWLNTREYEKGGALVSETEMELSFRRGSAEQTLRVASRFSETLEGEPLEAWLRQDLGTQPMETTFAFTASSVEAVHRQGESERRQRMPLPEVSWLTPRCSLAEIRRHLEAGASSFRFFTIDPQMGIQPFEVQWFLETREELLEVDGEVVKTSRWRQEQDYTPGLEYIVHLDAAGRPVRIAMPMLGMKMTVTRTSRAQALAPHRSPEVLARTYIYPDTPIPQPRATRRVVYELTLPEGALEGLPTVGAQRVEHFGDHARVVVDLDFDAKVPPKADEAPSVGGPSAGAYLRPSTYIDHEDPAVRRLHREATAGKDGAPEARIEQLRTFVAQHLSNKNLSTVLATASEVARSGSGDCTEHSVLLAALLRAEGIPSRVASGLVYVEHFGGEENLFAYHMWTQAYLDGRWIDLDATLELPFDAAHITFVTTGLEDQQTALLELARIAPLVGRLKVRVLDVH